MTTFAPSAVVPQLVAASALTQLNRLSVFPRAATGNYEPTAFEKGDTVTVRRARIVKSQDYDPRSGNPATSQEPGYASATLNLERLWTAGFPVFGSDNRMSASKYVNEYGEQIAQSIITDNDEYFYNKFRTLNLPSTGAYAYGSQPPISIVAATKSGQFMDFNKQLLINSGVVLNQNNVTPQGRFAILSSAASGAFLGDSVMVEGFTAATAGSANLLTSGISPGVFVPRYGFSCSSSNSVGFQIGQYDLDSGAAGTSHLAISAVAANPFFTVADFAAPTSLGAIDLTLTVSGSLRNVAVGQIAQLAPATGEVVAFGLILRVAANVVTLVPFSATGRRLSAVEIPTTLQFSIPNIPSISVAYQRESLIFATRNLAAPSEGSGAMMTTMADEGTGLVIQLFRGQYRVDEFRETQRYAMLIGALLSDHRKACLMLSL